jgi:uncharacterized protein
MTTPTTDPTSSTAPAVTSRADVATDAPGRYAKQLLSHLGRKVEFVEEPTGTWTAHVMGSVARITVGDNVLVLQAEGRDEQSVARIEHALGNHLERFGQRKQLAVTWQRTAAA